MRLRARTAGFLIGAALAFSQGSAAQEAGVPKPAMEAWLRCLQGNSFSEVEKTPEHAVEVAFDSCREQESSAIREQFPTEASSPTTADLIRTRLRDGIKATLVRRVEEDRASDPELHARFADKVRQDERARAARSGTSATANNQCSTFARSALSAPNRLQILVSAASSSSLTTTMLGRMGPMGMDFPKDEFQTTDAFNQQRQSRWLKLLPNAEALVIRKRLSEFDVKYDADRGVATVEIASPVYDALRPNLNAVSVTLDYKILRPKTQFRGGLSQSVEIETSASSLKGGTHLSSHVIEIPMTPDRARRLKANPTLALLISLPIASDRSAPVLVADATKFDEKFEGDPRASLHGSRSYPVAVNCALLFSGTEMVADVSTRSAVASVPRASSRLSAEATPPTKTPVAPSSSVAVVNPQCVGQFNSKSTLMGLTLSSNPTQVRIEFLDAAGMEPSGVVPTRGGYTFVGQGQTLNGGTYSVDCRGPHIIVTPPPGSYLSQSVTLVRDNVGIQQAGIRDGYWQPH